MSVLPAGMNKSETAAYQWLKKNGNSGIVFNRRNTPDFYTDQGSFEVKKVYGAKTVVFTYRQLDRILKAKGKVLVFKEGESEPLVVLEPADFEGGATSVEKNGVLLRIADEGNNSTFLKIITNLDSVLAFEEWVAEYRREKQDRKITHGEALDELLRRVGKLPPKAKTYA